MRAAQKKREEEAAIAKKEAALDERRCKKARVLASEPKDGIRNVTMVGSILLVLSYPIANATHDSSRHIHKYISVIQKVAKERVSNDGFKGDLLQNLF